MIYCLVSAFTEAICDQPRSKTEKLAMKALREWYLVHFQWRDLVNSPHFRTWPVRARNENDAAHQARQLMPKSVRTTVTNLTVTRKEFREGAERGS